MNHTQNVVHAMCVCDSARQCRAIDGIGGVWETRVMQDPEFLEQASPSDKELQPVRIRPGAFSINPKERTMGDKKRNLLFGEWILRNYPKAQSALVVADGKFGLARFLAKHMNVRVFEPNLRKHFRFSPGITSERRAFCADTDAICEDVIVGMHPDEATGEIICAAKKNRVPFAVVPCCPLGRYSNGLSWNYENWMRRLWYATRENGGPTPMYSALRMKGRNQVLYVRG